MTDESQRDKRRGARVAMRVPVEVRGTSEDGTALEETAHTGVVGALGALLQTSRPLQLGTDVFVTNRFSQQTATFHVAWLGEQNTDGRWDVGIEAVQDLNDFWGIRFSSESSPTS